MTKFRLKVKSKVGLVRGLAWSVGGCGWIVKVQMYVTKLLKTKEKEGSRSLSTLKIKAKATNRYDTGPQDLDLRS